MRRREFITLFGAATLTSPVAAQVRQPAPPVVGFLNSGSAAQSGELAAAFSHGLSDAGFVDGRNVVIEYRWAQGDYARLSEMAADLVRRKVTVIVATGGTIAALAAKAATTTVPIVFLAGGDPVEDGLVSSLGHPGGNVTGMTVFSLALGAKRLELLRELLPTASVVAMLVSPTGNRSEQKHVQAAADNIGQQLRVLATSNDRELDAAFAEMAEQRIDGLLVSSHPFFTGRREELVLRTTRQRIPTVFPWREYAIGGGLLSDGTSLRHSYRQMAVYVVRILTGEKPADLPTQNPTTFEFVLNLKAAKVLGLTIPTSILLRADEVIE
jgi:putative tryptophan/tyrosine transport system substrate-binding protein